MRPEPLPLFPQTTYQCKYGDLWQLGDHFLLIGDSTSQSDVTRIMQRTEPAHAVLTDPPYGLINAEWDKTTLDFIPHLQAATSPHATCIFFCYLPFGFRLHEAMLQHQWAWRWDTVWVKVQAGFQVSKFRPLMAHEHLFAYARKGIPISHLTFNGYDAGETGRIWRHNATQTTPKDFYDRKKMPASQGHKDGKRWIWSTLPGRKKQALPEEQRTVHPTQKPPELIEKLVLLISNPGEIIYDCFLGSGTTLLACEKLGRRCIGIEKEPEYGKIILQRWQRHTGEEPLHLE